MKTVALVGALALALTLVVYRLAEAHATLIASEPSAGAQLAASPPRIRLVFSEPVEASLAKVSLIAGDGRTLALPTSADTHDVHAVIATVGSLTVGAYRVSWHVVSADGHPVGGEFAFGIGVAPTDTRVPASAPEMSVWGPAIAGAPIIPALLRGAGVGSLIALGGLLWFSVSSRSTQSRDRSKRVALWLSVAAPLLLGAHFVAWLVNASPDHQLSEAWVATALGSSVGRFELARTGLSILPLWALGLARRPSIALAANALALIATAMVGHSAAVHPEWAIPFKAVHLLALSIWLGGLVWIVVGPRDADDNERSLEVSRVSSAALWAVIAIAFSGIVQTRLLVTSMNGFSSAYGLAVIAKIVGLVVLVCFGAHHRRLLSRQQERAGVVALRASVAREIAVFSLVLFIAGFLAYLSPPGSVSSSQHPSSSELE